jgi:lipopolysaccharide export LptBFGC system permease protein LptF
VSAAGRRLRAIARRLCQPQTIEQVIDPVLADARFEFEDAIRQRRVWRACRLWLAGHLAILKVVAILAAARAAEAAHVPTPRERHALLDTLAIGTVMATASIVVLALVPLFNVIEPLHVDSARLLLLLVPQAIPIGLPVGLTFGVLLGVGRSGVTWRVRAFIFIFALVLSLVSLTLLGQVVPRANQAFRVALLGRDVPKGLNELSLPELHQLRRPNSAPRSGLSLPSDGDSVALAYHTRLALASTPVVVTLLALSWIGRRPRSVLMLAVGGAITLFGYYLSMSGARTLAQQHTLSAAAAAWTPNAMAIIVAVALVATDVRCWVRDSSTIDGR